MGVDRTSERGGDHRRGLRAPGLLAGPVACAAASKRVSPLPPHTATARTGRSGSPAPRTPHAVTGSASATRCTKAEKGSATGRVPTLPRPHRSPSARGCRGLVTASPSALASASDTPGDAASALVCAVNSAVPVRIIRCTSAPLAVSVPTPCTPRSSSGWCATINCAPRCAASSTVAAVASTANSTRRTGSPGSPHTSPTASHSCASSRGYALSSAAITSPTVTVTRGS